MQFHFTDKLQSQVSCMLISHCKYKVKMLTKDTLIQINTFYFVCVTGKEPEYGYMLSLKAFRS